VWPHAACGTLRAATCRPRCTWKGGKAAALVHKGHWPAGRDLRASLLHNLPHTLQHMLLHMLLHSPFQSNPLPVLLVVGFLCCTGCRTLTLAVGAPELTLLPEQPLKLLQGEACSRRGGMGGVTSAVVFEVVG
jgi:hypothetical protein